MKNKFDGTESLGGQRYEPGEHGGHDPLAYDCLAEIRDMRAKALQESIAQMHRVDRIKSGIPVNDPEREPMIMMAEKGLAV